MRALSSFTYRCVNGHQVTSPNFETHCPAYVKGKPCLADLISVGQARRKRVKR